MLVLILLSIPITFFGVLTEVAALDLAGTTSFLSALGQPQRDALASLCLDLHGKAFSIAEVFWGQWLFPVGVCVRRSGFIPRILGVLLWIAGCGYLGTAFAALVLPEHAGAIARVTGLLTPLELPMIFWLLIRGARPPRPSGAAEPLNLRLPAP
jgi:hypothetical protein